MNTFNKLLLENYYNNLKEETTSSTPPNNPIFPNDGWHWEGGRWVRNIPNQPADLIPIDDDRPTIDIVEPGDEVLSPGSPEIPPMPSEPPEPGHSWVCVRTINPDGSTTYQWVQTETINLTNPNLLQKFLRSIGGSLALWGWGLSWILFNPFEQSAGGNASILNYNTNDPSEWTYIWDEQTHQWVPHFQHNYPYGGGWEDRPTNYYA